MYKICHSLLYCTPTSCVRDLVSSAGASNSSTIARCWVFTSLSFLCLGALVKQNTIVIASGLRVCLDGSYPSNVITGCSKLTCIYNDCRSIPLLKLTFLIHVIFDSIFQFSSYGKDNYEHDPLFLVIVLS